jgi:hypothetical protein
MKLIKNYFPAIMTVIIALIAWAELSPLYRRARGLVTQRAKSTAAAVSAAE